MSEQPEVPSIPVNAPESPEIINEQDLIAASLAEVQAQMNEVEAAKVKAASAPVDATTAAMLSIAKSMETMMMRQEATRQIPINEVKPVTPWNPEGKTIRLAVKRPMYQHGIALNPLTLTEKTIDLFNQIKPGRYWNRKIEVQRFADGGINLQWAGSKIDQRIETYSNFHHIDDVLELIIRERAEKEAKRKAGVIDEDEVV